MESIVSLTDIMQFKNESTSDIFIKMEQLLIFLSEKVIYGDVFNWSIAESFPVFTRHAKTCFLEKLPAFPRIINFL